jgi:hypothetical protein
MALHIIHFDDGMMALVDHRYWDLERFLSPES